MKTTKVLNNALTDRISKEVFLAVYNTYLPNEWIKFTFKYFSKSTQPNDKRLSNIIRDILIILFLGGFLGTVLNTSRTFIAFMIYPFISIIFLMSILMFAAFLMNNVRLKKIMKLLKINKDGYDALISVYLSKTLTKF